MCGARLVPCIAKSLVCQESERILQAREEKEVEKIGEPENSEKEKIGGEPYTQTHPHQYTQTLTGDMDTPASIDKPI